MRIRNFRSMIIFLLIIPVILTAIIFARRFFRTYQPVVAPLLSLRQELMGTVFSDIDLLSLLIEALGFGEEKTYLVLFFNNTELRPGGGFIGVYLVVRVNRGNPTIRILEGTEALDRRATSFWKKEPPQPLTTYLGVKQWYFRDSNWSPDFVVNATRALEFYTGEQGVDHKELDGVIAITPTVFEEILRLTGPVTVEGMTFTAENATEQLEYEVEYGYENKGIRAEDRKNILAPLVYAVKEKLQASVKDQGDAVMAMFQRLLNEKHIFLFHQDPIIQAMIDKTEWHGRMRVPEGDALLWVDANLAALKTDHAIDRHLRYVLREHQDGSIIASATMRYVHTGTFDWRTTRYQTYARVFVPKGSLLKAVEVNSHQNGTQSVPLSLVDTGEEGGFRWFGTYLSLEPGTTEELRFVYELPKKVGEQINSGLYTLFVQKQAGTIAHRLTFDLNFDTTITAATPGESEDKWHDTRYEYMTDLRVDRQIEVRLNQ